MLTVLSIHNVDIQKFACFQKDSKQCCDVTKFDSAQYFDCNKQDTKHCCDVTNSIVLTALIIHNVDIQKCVCLQKDSKQCCDVTKLHCTHCFDYS